MVKTPRLQSRVPGFTAEWVRHKTNLRRKGAEKARKETHLLSLELKGERLVRTHFSVEGMMSYTVMIK